MSKKSTIVSAAAALVLSAGALHASTVSIGFESATLGFVNQTFVEDGFTIAATGGAFFQSEDGTDGPVEYEREIYSMGILTISNLASFVFESLDWQLEYGFLASIVVEGFFGGSSVGTDTFQTDNTNYQTFNAVALAGLEIDTLIFMADRDDFNGGSLDAVVLSDFAAPIPLPAAGWMLIAGLGGLAAMRRRTKTGA